MNQILEGTITEKIEDAVLRITMDYLPELMLSSAISFICSIVGIILFMPAYSSAKSIINGEEVDVKVEYGKTFDYFKLYLLYAVKVFLWSLLLIIPGIIKSFSYSLCFAIKNDDPDKKCIDCIRESQRLMEGRKERLFVQSIVFVLWVILFSIGLGVASSLLEFIPLAGGIFSEVLSALFTFYCEAVYVGILRVFYEETLKDEQILKDNPSLREKGITGVIRNESHEFNYSSYYARYGAPNKPSAQKQDIFEEAEKEVENQENPDSSRGKSDGNSNE
jgi:hypothetical protein